MTETFVDLTYRGLALGRRIKLTHVRATHGYLEHPTPMPVGTAVSMATDEGLVFDAVVEAIHEQVGGSEQAPGMRIKPVFATDQLQSWWTSHLDPEAATPPPIPERAKPVTVRPRTQTVPEPTPTAALAAGAPSFTPATEYADTPHAPTPAVAFAVHTIPGTLNLPPGGLPTTPDVPPARGGAATTVMNVVDQELLAQLTKEDGVEQLTRRTGDHAVIDDGMRTMVMDAVDPAALGLEVSTPSDDSEGGDDDDRSAAESGPIGDDISAAESGPIGAPGDDKKPKGAPKKRKKRR